MSEITQRLIESAFTDGALENLFGSVESYIKQASHSPLSKNDRELFMLHILALIETANEKGEEASKIVKKPQYKHYSEGSLEILLDAIQMYMEKIAKSPLKKVIDQEVLRMHITGAMMAAIEWRMPKWEVLEIVKKYYPESIKEELVAA